LRAQLADNAAACWRALVLMGINRIVVTDGRISAKISVRLGAGYLEQAANGQQRF
jgi:hypothetical protein